MWQRTSALLLLLVAFPVHASFFSWSSASSEDDGASNELVSPIVNREIQVSVKAPWPSSPYNVLCEAFAFINDYRFLDRMVKTPRLVDSYQQVTEMAVEMAMNSGLHSPLLHFALTMRSQSPTCELHRGLASQVYSGDGDAFCVVNGKKVVTDLGEISKALKYKSIAEEGKQALLLPGENPRVASENMDKLVVLYANIGSEEFRTWYKKLVELNVPLVVRHLGSNKKDSEETMLQGYGVRLDIRNVEYKVFDERQSTDEEASLVNATALEDTVPHFLAGVNLTALGLSDSKLQATLWKNHEAERHHAQLIPPTWQRRRLSLQAATVVATATGNELLTLQEVSQNLPSVASTLVHVDVPDALFEVADNMEQSLQHLMKNSGGGLWVNGIPLEINRPSFNVFEMIETLKKEQKEMDNLYRRLKPYLDNQKALAKVLEALSQGEEFFQGEEESSETQDEFFRVDVESGEKGATIYLNDIEKDPQYEQFPTSLQQMLMGLQMGMPPAVRRNLFTILVVEDPTKGVPHLGRTFAAQIINQRMPVAYTVLVVDEDDIEECMKWVQETNPELGVPCPHSGDSWLDRDDDVFSTKELKGIDLTARDVYHMLAYISHTFDGRRDVLAAFSHDFDSSLTQETGVSLFEALKMFSDILEGLGVIEMSIAPADLAKKLHDFEEDNFQYEKGVRLAVDKNLKPGMSFLNGRSLPIYQEATKGGNNPSAELSQLFQEEFEVIMGMIMAEDITDSRPKSIYKSILSGKKAAANVFPKVHPLLASSKDGSFIDLDHKFGSDSFLFAKTSVVSPSDADSVIAIDAVIELNTRRGSTIAKNLISVMEKISNTLAGSSVAVAYRFIPSTKEAAKSALCPIVSAGAGTVGASVIREVLDWKMGDGGLSESTKKLLDSIDSVAGTLACRATDYMEGEFPSKNFIVANGRFMNILGTSLDTVDVELLMSLDLERTKVVTKTLREFIPGLNSPYDAVARTASFLSTALSESSRSSPNDAILKIEESLHLKENPLRFSWNEQEGGSSKSLKVNKENIVLWGIDVCWLTTFLLLSKMSVTAIVDPVTETAQRISPLLRVIRDELKLPLMLVLAPTMNLDGASKIPIASYYRFVADPLAYQDNQSAPQALFSNLPTDHVLTVRMDVPEPWDIQQAKSVQDTDNLRCDLKAGCSDNAAVAVNEDRGELYKQKHVTNVEYILNHLLVFGRCIETTGNPPNGLQLTLSKNKGEGKSRADVKQVEIEADGSVRAEEDANEEQDRYYSDTLVMKNLGYWQLRANPGVWDLNFAKNSRGAEIFDMVERDAKGVLQVSETGTNYLVMGNFVGSTSMLRVKRKLGHEESSLFYDDSSSDDDEDDIVHVFSLATGHLYERFLKIMMLSVTKRTSSKVKFWLFENFLSPTFKASARAMAERIGCDVEFVTYKWPEWLRGQSEKQRIIWGYKILFLDVLFPLNLKKIIYVDADQVIRGDLKELRDMDLGGAPYGYTPMCSSRESTLGFQFWNTGFWKNHLRGRPYHISALYVVDLERFRKTLVGDNLRAIYQQLSADPNSLANLDQDLPNFAQHQVPIFSLPQEWLWCESWCSDETKLDAKTIDLCNNPLHKEPKVSMAKRIISGDLFEESWIELDAEVEKYEKEYFDALGTCAGDATCTA